MADSTDSVLEQQAGVDDPTGRLAAYLARTQTPLDILALLTLWIVIVPPGDFGSASNVAILFRLALSGVYAVDITVRAAVPVRSASVGWQESQRERHRPPLGSRRNRELGMEVPRARPQHAADG